MKGQGKKYSKKKAVWIDALIHAREWVAGSSALYYIHQLTRHYMDDAVLSQLLDQLDFYVMPVVNPDGYQYTQRTDIPVNRLQYPLMYSTY